MAQKRKAPTTPALSARNGLTIALLRACGIPHDDVRTVEYFHDANGTPEITVTYAIPDTDLGYVEEITQTWEMTQESRRG